jgi:hypothetical protein
LEKEEKEGEGENVISRFMKYWQNKEGDGREKRVKVRKGIIDVIGSGY